MVDTFNMPWRDAGQAEERKRLIEDWRSGALGTPRVWTPRRSAARRGSSGCSVSWKAA